jgi:hypothetical protein
MVFRRNLFGSRPSLLASLPRATDRDSTLARREALAREEARLTQRINQLRGEMDDLSNSLHRPNPTLAETHAMMVEEAAAKPVDAAAFAAFVCAAGEKSRARTAPALPKDATARFIVLAGLRARNQKIPDDN